MNLRDLYNMFFDGKCGFCLASGDKSGRESCRWCIFWFDKECRVG